MNVQDLNQTTVIPAHCVPTRRDPTFVAASKVLRVMAKTAQVKAILSFASTGLNSRLITFFLCSAVAPGCFPSCGPNALCQEGVGAPSCVCNFGYQGDGYDCTGWYSVKKYYVLFIPSTLTSIITAVDIRFVYLNFHIVFDFYRVCFLFVQCFFPQLTGYMITDCSIPLANFSILKYEWRLFYLDIDECTSPGSNECDANALCTNTEGSYVCRCFKGFKGDGKTCTGKISWFPILSQRSSWTHTLIKKKSFLRWRRSYSVFSNGRTCLWPSLYWE